MKHVQRILSILFLMCVTYQPYVAHAKTLMNQIAISQFYDDNDGQPIWISGSRITRDAKDVIAVLEQSWMNGLNPEKYHLPQIHEILNGGRKVHPDNLTLIEMLITDAFVEYIRDISGMRVDANDLGLSPKEWKQKISAQEALSYLEINIDDAAEFMLSQEPQTKTYQALKSELIRLVRQEGSSNEKRVIFSAVMRPGRGYDDIPKLRAKLGVQKIDGVDRYKYDEALFQAVKYFQEQKGLKPDGIIGKQTLFALNQTNTGKIKQIIVNMERLRWIAENKPSRFIIVNIPSYTLWAIEDGNIAFEMPVIVGRKKRKTQSFVSKIHGVRFNPTWTVPKTIKKEDILPKLQEDPMHLSGKAMELYDGYGPESVTLDPTSIDWNNITDEQLQGLRMVQKAGANNPLGDIRVLMPNTFNIYLHDTNDKSLFSRADRAKSSGCIRMKEPEKVAQFILNTKDDWSRKKMDEILQSEKTRDIYTSENMPVYLLYHTAWIGDDSQIIYSDDIYDYDKKLLQALEKLDEIPEISEDKGSIVLAYQ